MSVLKEAATRSLVLGTILVLAAGCCPDGEGSAFSEGGQTLLEATPNPVVFASVTVGTTQSLTVAITNGPTATESARIESVTFVSASDELSITQPDRLDLAAGEGTTLSVTYAPTDSVADQGTIVVTYNGNRTLDIAVETGAQTGSLVFFYQQVITFGEVNAGTSKTETRRGENTGTAALEVGPTRVEGVSPDFKVGGVYLPEADGECGGFDPETSEVLEQPFILAPGESYCVDVVYTPFGGGADQGLLVAYAPYDPSDPTAAEVLAQIPISGSEVGPDIEIKPEPKINFGGVPVGEEKIVSFEVHNVGTKELNLTGVVKAVNEDDAEAFADVEILTEIPEGTTLAPGAEPFIVEVKFAPSNPYPVSYGALGFLAVQSDDLKEPEAFVSVFGQVASPKLQVTPLDVNFGVVAQNNKSERKITFTNVGTVEAHVSDLVVTQGQNAAAGEFTFKFEPQQTIVIAPNDFYVVTVVFENTVDSPGQEVFGTVTFTSDDPGAATTVNLKATRTDKAECRLSLEPQQLNFGTVPYDKKKTLAFNIINTGSSPCSWSHALVSDGSAEFFGQGGCHLLPEQTPASNSKNFKIVKAPPAIKDGIQPGQSYPLEIQYAPEANLFSGAFDEFAEYVGLVQVTVLDYAQADIEGDPKALKFPEPLDPNGMDPTKATCNLRGKSGVAQLSAIPGVVEFSTTTVGCHSKTHTITFYNLGTAPLEISDIYLDGCTPEFKLKKVPPIPAGGLILQGQGSFEVEVVYAPQDTNFDSCSLAVDENDTTKSAVVPLSGEGTYDTDQTDVFQQLAGQEVDVLFIVDNSGSMSDEQNNLATNFGAFTNSAGLWDTDYQIGVITTDIDETNSDAARLMAENGVRFFTSANNNISQFSSAVKVGDNGSGTEQGLEAARLALSHPLASKVKPETTCTDETQCADSGSDCVPSVTNPGTSYCGGWNMEFLREDATLELVFVSDEEDGSSAQLNFYVDFFKSIKGFANENLFHAHAIVGDSGGCDGAGGSASDGQRYRHVANETGGKFHSICSTNWAQKLEDIGEVAFGLKVQFFLSRPAVPETIEVTVAGSKCNTGWNYDAEANAILFDQFGTCMPQEGEEIEVYYEVICYGE